MLATKHLDGFKDHIELTEMIHFLNESQRMASIYSWSWDLQTGKVIWSDEAFNFYGLARQKPSFELAKSLVHPEDQAVWTEAVLLSLKGIRPFAIDHRALRGDGTVIWVRSQCEIIRDENGQPVKVWGTTQDITERKQVEDALGEREEKYERLFNLLSDPILLTEKETGRILEVNPAAEKCYGYSRLELRRLCIKDMLADDCESVSNVGALEEVIPIRQHKRKNGATFPVDVSANHFTWQGREVQLSVIRDISSRIEAEKQRIRLENQLLQAQKMEAIGTLAGGIAHDFNNILSSIIGYTELVFDAVKNDPTASSNLNEAVVACMRARDLIRQILTFSRQTEEQRQPVLVAPIVDEISRMMRATLPATIDLKIYNQAKDSTIFGDSTHIHQILLNLCTNAAHAMDEENGTLSIRADKVTLTKETPDLLDEVVPGRYLRLSVSDTGCGISPEVMERIFEPYLTTKKEGKGSGLGLAVVHGIVKSYSGNVAVRSQPGQGTTIKVYLPLVKKSDPVPYQSDDAIPTGKEHILLVDDEQQIISYQKQILERLGYTVSAWTSSLDAWDAFNTDPDSFHALITDLTMPNMTGDRLAQRIKNIRPELPVLLCTGYSDKLTDGNTRLRDIDHFLMKPVGKRDLARALREILDN